MLKTEAQQKRSSSRPLACSVPLAVVLLVLGACTRTGTQGATPSADPEARSAAVAPEATEPGQTWPASFGIGRPASAAEIAAVDIDVRPDGAGLPAGTGTVATGKALYAAKCAACHGPTGTEGPNDKLVSLTPNPDFSFGRDLTQVRTIGNYWPYATTLFDYLWRAMPYNAPGSLTPDEVYSLTAYLLHLNQIEPLKDGTARQFSFEMDARSIITFPAYPVSLERGWVEIRGLAWSGRGKIVRVEVSIDAGKSWSPASLEGLVLDKGHTRFRYLWRWNGAETEIMSRAVDETGYTQPTRTELIAARGVGAVPYHLNPITAWRVKRDGQVVYRPEAWK